MSARSIVVVGDVLLDVDVQTSADRLSPDGPAPVLDEVSRVTRPGGAALAALLAARDRRVRVTLVAPLPDDDAGAQLRSLLHGAVRVIALPAKGSTAVKTRLRCGAHTVARLDQGGQRCTAADLTGAAVEALHGADAVLVSDYGRGATQDAALRALLATAAQRVPLVWDPHPRGDEPVPGARLVTPNVAEAAAAAGARGEDVATLRTQADALLAHWSARSVAITLGERGALLSFGAGGSELVPGVPVSGDPCGAGDSFAAAATVALARGALASEAVTEAVAAASRFVAAGGVSTLTAGADRTAGVRGSEVAADAVVASVRARGGRLVATGGCFDLLHAGHVATLSAARALGDCLVVCVNSDDSVRRLKGAGRPLQPLADRVQVLAALQPVDAVIVFDEDTPEQALARLRPDVWVKGGDYSVGTLPETSLLRSWGGEVVTVPYLAGRSTSELVDLARR